MNYKVIRCLYKKEILDVLRDKKTVLMMLVVPLVVYPLLIVLTMQIMTTVTTEMSENTYIIGLGFDDYTREIERLFEDNEEDGCYFDVVYVNDSEESLRTQSIDVYVTRGSLEGTDTSNIRESFVVYYLSAVTNSNYAATMVRDVLAQYSNNITVEIIEEAGLNSDEVLNPVEIDFLDLSSSEESAGNLLGNLVSFMLIVSLLMGTMYPAIDTTAGERERGTLETVLTLPVSNQELIMSKFLTVATIGIVSALLNVISMGGIGVYMINMMQTMGASEMNVSLISFLPAILICVLCIFAFAVFISAITMCVCAFAKTYKEANNYITPLMLVVMFASFVGFVPNVELTTNMALVPVVNICLLVRDILVFKFNTGIIACVLISNVAYGIIAVMLLGKIYNSEAILFGDSSTSVQILERRSNMKKGGVPTIGDAWLVVAITAVSMIYVGGMLQVKLGYYGMIGSQLLFFAIPLVMAVYTKKDIKKTFKLKLCKPKFIIAGFFMTLGAIMIGIVLSGLMSAIFKGSAQSAAESMDYLLTDNIIKMIFVVAVVPGICEELLFRGYLLSSVENKLKPRTAILVVAVIFGVFHMSVVKFLTTALLGYVFAYLALKSKSIFPGMLMHFMNNSLSCILMMYPEKIGKIIPIFADDNLSISELIILLAVGAVCMVLGRFVIGKKEEITQ